MQTRASGSVYIRLYRYIPIMYTVVYAVRFTLRALDYASSKFPSLALLGRSLCVLGSARIRVLMECVHYTHTRMFTYMY